MNERIDQALETCLSAMESGLELEQCLALFPELADELRPALEAAQLARSLADRFVPKAALQRSRARLLAKAVQLRASTRRRRSPFAFLGRAPRMVLAAALLALVFLLSWRGLVVVSAKALPGDPLYPVKRASENLSLRVAPDLQARRAVEARNNQRRVEEVAELLALGRLIEVEFIGVVDEQAPDRWTIDGIAVSLTADTPIFGAIETGMVVVVEGQTQPSGTVSATSIRLYSYQFVGRVETLGETEWVISGVPLRVGMNSQIDPALHSGDLAIVLVEVQEGQPLFARAILQLLPHVIVPKVSLEEGDQPSPPLHSLKAGEVEITGKVEAITSSALLIDGQLVFIEGMAEIEGAISVGDYVTVEALMAGDGTLVAKEIERSSEADGDEFLEGEGDVEDGEDSGASGEGDDAGEEDDGDGGGQDSDEGDDAGENGEQDDERGEEDDGNPAGDDDEGGEGSSDDGEDEDGGGGEDQDDDGSDDPEDDDGEGGEDDDEGGSRDKGEDDDEGETGNGGEDDGDHQDEDKKKRDD